MKQFMRVHELADYLDVSKNTIYRAYHDGELPGFHIRGVLRFRREAVEAYIRAAEQADPAILKRRSA